MDGVPDISNAPIAPGQMYVYEYPIRQSGTYWYHSHVGFQEQLGCYGAFIIEPAHEPLRVDHDAVVLLGDWLHRSPAEVFDAAARRDGAERRAMQMGTGQPAMKMDGMKMDGAAKSRQAAGDGGGAPISPT